MEKNSYVDETLFHDELAEKTKEKIDKLVVESASSIRIILFQNFLCNHMSINYEHSEHSVEVSTSEIINKIHRLVLCLRRSARLLVLRASFVSRINNILYKLLNLKRFPQNATALLTVYYV